MAMKFGPDILLEIVAIVQEGFVKHCDVSQLLRDVRVECDVDDLNTLVLARDYVGVGRIGKKQTH